MKTATFLWSFGLLVLGAATSVLASDSVVPQEDLVLWLDAAELAGHVASDGRITQWRDRSAEGNHARQTDRNLRPQWVEAALGDRPAVRFRNGQFLNLGQPASLDFPPGQAFTIIAAYSVAEGKFGTLLAKGGGPQQGREYHLYTATGRLGGVVHGTRHETPIGDGPRIAAMVCDGRHAELRHDGAAVRFQPGKGSTAGDVLIGVRRETAQNTGVYWPLEGELAELLVYRSALDKPTFDRVETYLRNKYGFTAPQDALTEDIQKHPARAAESLLRLAQQNELSPDLADLAGELLESSDPFARGMAEWAIAMKIGGENNGQAVVWTREAAEPWFQRYLQIPPAQRREADWVRQAVTRNIHRDPAKLSADVDAMLQRAEQMATDFRLHGELPDGFDAQLAVIRSAQAELAAIRQGDQGLSAAQQTWLDARRAMREIALANPSFDFGKIVFLTQFAPHTMRNITRSYSWKHKPGGDIEILDDIKDDVRARPLLAGRLGPGYVWGLDLWWDGDRVLFSYARLPKWPPPLDTTSTAIEGQNVFPLRKIFEPVRLYEAAVDGSQITQLTNDPYWSDFEPAYTAAGDVVFASDRCSKAPECGNVTYDHTNPNLYILSRRDSRLVPPTEGGLARYEPAPVVRKFTDSKDLDRYPYSLDDGRIVYTHWEYQERHFMEVHALWTARPDGTMSDALFKQHMSAPLALRSARSIPGTARLVAVATGHHTFSYGAVVTVDPAHGLNSVSGLRLVTPNVKLQEGPLAGRPVDRGGVPDPGGLYRSPWALSEQCFLVAYAYARPKCTGTSGVDSNGFGLYLIDAYGNRELLHRDPLLSCASPIPLRPRQRPPIIPTVAETPETPKRATEAVCYVPDVYDGMPPEIPRGTIKYLRIAQHVPWPYDQVHGTQDYISGNAGSRHLDFKSWAPVRVFGTVPVEPDGSAHSTVPSYVAIYFQALDQRHMEVQRMRSFVSMKAGEVRGCRGCHESQAQSPAIGAGFGLAMSRAPSTPTPPPWGSERTVDYEAMVQPVFERNCTECHGNRAPQGNVDLSAVRMNDGLLMSYHTLFGSRGDGKETAAMLVSTADRFSNAGITQPKQFGSHQSRLIHTLLEDPFHRKSVKLNPDEWETIVTWIDANAPYFGGFLNKRPDSGGPPRREPPADCTTQQ